MISWFKGIRHPDAYHGSHGQRPFFEGWYHKMVTKDGEAIAVIPGVYRSSGLDHEFAFIMIYNSVNDHVHFERFSIDDFKAYSDSYSVRIGENRFSSQGLELKINSPDISIRGNIGFSMLSPWPVTWREPGCMGWYGYVPFMECFHGILSMDHSLTGRIIYDDIEFDFGGGIGYIEKDWGRNFPRAWIWTQANHFQNRRMSLSASIAVVPYQGREFAGFIIGLLYDDHFHRFTTYRGGHIKKLEIVDSKVRWILEQDGQHLEIRISPGEKTGCLFAPGPVDMVPKVPEYLDANVRIIFDDGSGTILEDESNIAALETVGDLDDLLKMALSD